MHHMIAGEDGYNWHCVSIRTPYRARGVNFRWVECSVATGLLKSSPDFLSKNTS